MIGIVIFGILFGISIPNDNLILLIISIIGVISSTIFLVYIEEKITSEGMKGIGKKDIIIIILIASSITVILILKYLLNLI
jgi:phosphatidylglycerophosphate synthase